MTRKKKPEPTVADLAWRAVAAHPMFAPMTDDYPRAGFALSGHASLGERRTFATVDVRGQIVGGKWALRHTEAEWTWVFAHCLLHLGFGHVTTAHDEFGARAACLAVTRFQRAVKLGTEPILLPADLPALDEEVLARQWRARGAVPDDLTATGTGGFDDCLNREVPAPRTGPEDWPGRFAVGLSAAATAAVEVAAGARASLTDPGGGARKPWQRAMGWFASSYPLLGGLASGFRIVADVPTATRFEIGVAAVSASAGEIYINPLRTMGEAQWRFVLAHEMLHAALRHGDRAGGRDPYLWNVAADYVINGWLVEMGVGEVPDGVLHDPDLAGLSAEAVYDRIAGDLRRLRRLGTLRGQGKPDILGDPLPWARSPGGGVDLDEFCRRALLTGYAYHHSQGRGLLPAGLEAEIRVLEHPPLPWDARLARWFDEFVPGPEPRRSFARPSRRQASAPHIPRPGRWVPDEPTPRHTFGVVLDTSGSMNHELLGKALGAIASYATARDVPAARVVFCDAVAYDAGYLTVDEIAGRVRVRGRGGTILQPGVDLLERAPDFPAAAPILIITDGWCDAVRVRREHAYLTPAAARLPFTPRGPVFEVR
ncbi:putative metal-dependent peptidase [Catenuloplanes nepalensis]|uniref:Metal-dependent peptidase n=1 Tax=Catenuloplanes nepalensis TaxID=587533 RepID=A0ABT9MPR3_9ACTN|nr:hypothetical protein [Catenuloplanes nepalensis]MDP9793418.1 putative metal-dependent peptidase [Catenuloplanes nepalensis]